MHTVGKFRCAAYQSLGTSQPKAPISCSLKIIRWGLRVFFDKAMKQNHHIILYSEITRAVCLELGPMAMRMLWYFIYCAAAVTG